MLRFIYLSFLTCEATLRVRLRPFDATETGFVSRVVDDATTPLAIVGHVRAVRVLRGCTRGR